MPAAEVTAKSAKTTAPAFEKVACATCTELAAAVATEEVAPLFPVGDALPRVALLAGVLPEGLLLLLLLLLLDWVSRPISLSSGLQTTTDTRLLKHSPRSCHVCLPSGKHWAVQGSGFPSDVMLRLWQQAYMSQKAWSLCSMALEITQLAFSPSGRSNGEVDGLADADGAAELAEHDITGPKEKMPVGISFGFVKRDGDGLV